VFFDSRAADAMKRGSVFIDMASIPPKMAQEHAAWLSRAGRGKSVSARDVGKTPTARGRNTPPARRAKTGESVCLHFRSRRFCVAEWLAIAYHRAFAVICSAYGVVG
jgi:hypothetical protein